MNLQHGHGPKKTFATAVFFLALSVGPPTWAQSSAAAQAIPGSPEKPLTLVPGVTTMADLVAAGFREVLVDGTPVKNGERGTDGKTYIRFNDMLIIGTDGVTSSFLFDVGKGTLPPEWMIGVKLDPKLSYVEMIDYLLDSGFELKELKNPDLTLTPDEIKRGEVNTNAFFVARGKTNPDIAWWFAFKTKGLWSPNERGLFYWVYAYPIKTFTDKAVKISRPPVQAAGDERQRALDLGVMLAAQNGETYSSLMPDRTASEYDTPEGWQTFISGSWNIKNREDYFRVYDDMVAEGHSKSYTDAMALLDANPGVPIVSIALANGLDSYHCDRLFFAAQTRSWLGARSLRAWDLGRMINVTRWAYASGYIDETEAWDRILPVAKTLRETYRSREDFIASYLGGRGFFGADDPYAYMIEALKSYQTELQKLDSRQHLPWYLPGESPSGNAAADLAGGEAKIEKLLYTLTDEQTSARLAYERLNKAIDEANAAIKVNDALAALTAMDTAEIILKGNRLGEYCPDLYYQIRFVRGNILFATGNYRLALETYEEVDERYPQSEDILTRLAACRERLQGNGEE